MAHKIDFNNLLIDDVIEGEEEIVLYYDNRMVPEPIVDTGHNIPWERLQNIKLKNAALYHGQIVEWLKELKKLRSEIEFLRRREN